MAGLPREIMELARIDGASDFEIFVKIVLPLSFPVLASFAIFQFLWVWNDLLVAMVFLGTENDQLVLTGQAQRAARLARRRLGDPDDIGLRHHHRAADRVLLAAALFRPRPARRLGEGRLRRCNPLRQATLASRDLAADRDWWRGAVIYQIYPRSYQDSNGDGIGDLKGIIRRLPYIAALGVDAIWISPFFKSPMKDFGYDVSDYCDVDPMFGTLADFDALIAEAHRLGLKVMIDQVLSHTADQHPWFKESRSSRDNPKADWYVWADAKPDGTPPNNWLSIFGGSAWQWDTRRQQYYLHNFLAEQPDLNFHNPRGAGRAARRHPLLAGARRRRLPARHDQLLLPRPGPGGQSAAAGRASATTRPRRRSIPTITRTISTTRAGRRTSASCDASAPCSTSIRRPRRSAKSATRSAGWRSSPPTRPATTGCRCATPSISWRPKRSARPRCAGAGSLRQRSPATAGRAGPSPTMT